MVAVGVGCLVLAVGLAVQSPAHGLVVLAAAGGLGLAFPSARAAALALGLRAPSNVVTAIYTEPVVPDIGLMIVVSVLALPIVWAVIAAAQAGRRNLGP